MGITVLLAAGGTGGHVFPALALADELHSRDIHVVFVTEERGIKFIKDRPWMRVHQIQAGTLRKHPVRFFTDLYKMATGIVQSFGLLREVRPDVVIGFGGYPCFPPLFAAQIMRIATALHEQNAVLGRANRRLAQGCNRLALSFPNFTGLNNALRAKTMVTGNPVRPEIAALAGDVYPVIEADGKLTVLIYGGSLGAGVFGRVIPEALRQLDADEKEKLRIIQQVRAEDIDRVNKVYAEAEIEAETATFFNNMPALYRRAHLFVGRSGASTVAEMTVVGRPALFVPAPYHGDAQQTRNAEGMEKAGAARIIPEADFTPERVLAELRHFMHSPQSLPPMAEAARRLGHVDAVQKLAEVVLGLA